MAVDAALGYHSELGGFAGKGHSIGMGINNWFKVRKFTVSTGTQKVSGDDPYFVLPGRGVALVLSMKF